MEKILACCGYRCDLCPAYLPNIKNENDKQVASDGWYKYYGFRIPAKDIGCVGCPNEGKLMDSDCPVRPCVREKNFKNCAECDGFICEKLGSRVDFIEKFENKLENISDHDYQKFIRPYQGKRRLKIFRAKLKNLL